MNAPAFWLPTGTGLVFDLLQPRAEMIDLKVDVAEALARVPRFAGHVRSGAYSVAQHSVMGADALWRETGRRDLAAAFLLHDGHEFVIGDITTPVAGALTRLGGPQVGRAIEYLKRQVDRAVFQAAGMEFPFAPDVAAAVKAMDWRMLATERRHLVAPTPLRWAAEVEAAKPIRLVGKFRVWPWPEAADEFRARLDAYLPRKKRTAA